MSDYILASDEELARLQLQARVWEPEAEAMLDRINPQPGWSCLDLGCGAMGILGPLKRRVGSDGRVVGFDADEKMIQAAGLYAQKEGLPDIELHAGDATNTGLPASSFDLVHARFLFPHISKPETLLQEMIRLTKPGGIIASEEPDHSSWNFYPPCGDWTELLELLEKTLSLRGDINIGRRMYELFREVGLKDVAVRAGVNALQNNHPYMSMPIVAAQAMKSHMLKAGWVDEKKLDKLIESVASCAKDEERMQVTFTTIQVWGRKS